MFYNTCVNNANYSHSIQFSYFSLLFYNINKVVLIIKIIKYSTKNTLVSLQIYGTSGNLIEIYQRVYQTRFWYLSRKLMNYSKQILLQRFQTFGFQFKLLYYDNEKYIKMMPITRNDFHLKILGAIYILSQKPEFLKQNKLVYLTILFTLSNLN